VSFGTLAGFLGGLFLFIFAVLLSVKFDVGFAADSFFQVSGLIMVFGGTLANAYICYQSVYVNKAIQEIFKIFSQAKIDQEILIKEINKSLSWADIAFKEGATGLEDYLANNEPNEHLLSFGIDLVLRQYDPSEIRELMTNTIESEFQRVSVEADVIDNMAANAPAFGMVGTLVGLVIMLSKMGDNPEEIGSGLALALLTTLYGVLAARLVFQPASKKVYQRGSIQRFRNYLMMEIFIMIAETRPATYVRDRIRSFLRPSMLSRIDNPREKRPSA